VRDGERHSGGHSEREGEGDTVRDGERHSVGHSEREGEGDIG
jgi:hypothetical protein